MSDPAAPTGLTALQRGILFVGVLVLALAGIAVAAKAIKMPTTSPDPAPTAVATAADDPTTQPSPTSTQLGDSEPTLVLGDSLALDVYPYLANLLPDRYVTYVAKVGRSTEQIAAALAEQTDFPNVVVVSAGTNDWASADFTTSAENIMNMLGPHRCVVWMDVARPQRTDPNLGLQEPDTAINAALGVLAAEHSNIHVVLWSELAASHPEWFGADGIHPNDDGIKARADAMSQAAANCSALNPTAPIAPQESLPPEAFN